MREERGRLSGDQVIYEPFELWGSVGGDVRVVEGGKLYVRGTVYGNLTVEDGGRCHVFGNVTGSIYVKEGAKAIHSGVVGHDVVNQGGRLVVDAMAKVMGKIRTKSGETKLEGKHREKT
jgi:hypothetical protein